jgi:hypothetical protein
VELQLNTDIIREQQSKRQKFGITTIFRQDYTNGNERNMESQRYSDKTVVHQ